MYVPKRNDGAGPKKRELQCRSQKKRSDNAGPKKNAARFLPLFYTQSTEVYLERRSGAHNLLEIEQQARELWQRLNV